MASMRAEAPAPVGIVALAVDWGPAITYFQNTNPRIRARTIPAPQSIGRVISLLIAVSPSVNLGACTAVDRPGSRRRYVAPTAYRALTKEYTQQGSGCQKNLTVAQEEPARREDERSSPRHHWRRRAVGGRGIQGCVA